MIGERAHTDKRTIVRKRGHRRSAKGASGRRTGWTIAIAIAGIVIGVSLAFIAGLALDLVKSVACPSGTFMYGSTDFARTLFAVPFVAAGIVAVWPVVGRTSQHLSLFEKKPAKEILPRWLKLDLKLLQIVAGGLGAVAVALWGNALAAGFCAGEMGMQYRDAAWSEAKLYSWRDITRMAAVCTTSSGIDRASFMLFMKDGQAIDVFDMPRSFFSGFPAMREALRETSFAYDGSQVTPNCSSSLRTVLQR